ncbi:MAG TPA: hypothetical protein VF676_03265 [Flavobacterium sp.]|jgi:hypothetical protein
MKTTRHTVDELRKYGYNLDFSDTFNIAFEAYKKMALVGGVVVILFSLLCAVIGGTVIGGMVGFSVLADSMVNFNFQDLPALGIFAYIIGMAAFTGVMNAFTAGLIKMAHNAHTNQEVGLGTGFEYFKGRYFGELFLAGFALGIFTTGISVLGELYDFQFIVSIITIVLSIFTLFTIPLIIFADFKAMDAIAASFGLSSKNFFMIFGLLIVAGMFAAAGIIAFCIGVFFTLPFVYAMYYSIYVNSVGIDDRSEFDEIGTNWE